MAEVIKENNTKIEQLSTQINYLAQKGCEDLEGFQNVMKSIEYRVSNISQQLSSSYQQRHSLPQIQLPRGVQTSQTKDNNMHKNKEPSIPYSKQPPQHVPQGDHRKQSKRYSEYATEIVKNAKKEANLITNFSRHSSTSLLDLRKAKRTVISQIASSVSVSDSTQLMSLLLSASKLSKPSNTPVFAPPLNFFTPADALLHNLNNSINNNNNINNSQSNHLNNISMISRIDPTQVQNTSLFANEDSVIHNLNVSIIHPDEQSSILSHKKLNPKLKKGKLSQPKVLPKEIRDNPFAVLPVVKEKQLEDGLFELINRRIIPRDTDVEPAFSSAGVNVIKTTKKQLRPFQEKLLPRPAMSYEESILSRFHLDSSVNKATTTATLDLKNKMPFETENSYVFLTAAGMLTDRTRKQQQDSVTESSQITKISKAKEPQVQKEEQQQQQQQLFSISSSEKLNLQSQFESQEQSQTQIKQEESQEQQEDQEIPQGGQEKEEEQEQQEKLSEKNILDTSQNMITLDMHDSFQQDISLVQTNTNQTGEQQQIPQLSQQQQSYLLQQSQLQSQLSQIHFQQLPIKVVIAKGSAKQDVDYYRLKEASQDQWGCVRGNLTRLEVLARKYEIQHMEVDGDKFIEISSDLTKTSNRALTECLLNRKIVGKVMPEDAKNGSSLLIKMWAAARMTQFLYVVRAKQELQAKKKNKRTIEENQRAVLFWLLYFRSQRLRTIEKKNQLLEYASKVEQFKMDWSVIKTEERIEVLLSSYSFDEFQRISLTSFVERQNAQILRIFSSIMDPKVQIIYVLSESAKSYMENYIKKLFSVADKAELFNKITFICPENGDKFPSHFSLAKLLYYSPLAMKQISRIIYGKVAYLIPSVPSNEDRLIGMELQIPLFYGDNYLAQQLRKRENSRKLIRQLDLPLTEGEEDIYSEEQLIDKLTLLIVKDRFSMIFFIKLNSEIEGRGIALFKTETVKYFRKLRTLTECTFTPKRITKIRNIIKDILPLSLNPCMKSLFSTYNEFLARIIEEGCIVEVQPLQEVSGAGQLSMLVEPDGRIQVLASFDKIQSHENITCGYTFPQRQITNLDEVKLCSQIGKKLHENDVWGHFKLDYLVLKNKFHPQQPANDNQELHNYNSITKHQPLFQLMSLDPILDSATCQFMLCNFLCEGKYLPISHRYSVENSDSVVEQDDAQDGTNTNNNNNSIIPLQLRKKANAMPFNFQGTNQENTTPTVPKEEKYFTFIPLIFHQGLKSTNPRDFFSMCRQANISFDISKRAGTLFFVPGDMTAGTLILISISNDQKSSVSNTVESLKFLTQKFGEKVHFESDKHGSKADNYFLINTLGSVRQLNKQLR